MASTREDMERAAAKANARHRGETEPKPKPADKPLRDVQRRPENKED
jgi:hypothetical protein